MPDPRLRTAQKVKPPYPLNKFQSDFPYIFGKEIVYHHATSANPNIEGEEWERIFALSINGKWKPSNVGLDDITLGVCAWGAKSVKASDPFSARAVRLISGRNSLSYSFQQHDLAANADVMGGQVLDIWNTRVENLRDRFSHLRTVVLVKSNDLTKFVVFETETVMYLKEKYAWKRNTRGNLEGFDKKTKFHKFTWQPHGSQFTIVEEVPSDKLCIQIKAPSKMRQEDVLKTIKFDKSWIKVINP